MYSLGIETSCDETSASVVKNGRWINSQVTSSSLAFHKKHGGIIPEIAFRKQLEAISAVTQKALCQAGLQLPDIGLISVTHGPGLLGSLLVGLSFAKSLSLCRDIPLIGINHLEGHIYSGLLEREPPKFPFIGLVVSGGHTSLYRVNDFDEMQLLGSTLDDACGESFDKVSKILGLGYPGGPAVEKEALRGDPSRVKFNCCTTARPYDFSFSGIKTAVLYYVKQRKRTQLPSQEISDVCASFQTAVIKALVAKTIAACRAMKTKTLVTGGGVMANGKLRQELSRAAQEAGISCFIPEKSLCMDNAAMIAGLGWRLYAKGYRGNLCLNPELD